MKLSIVAGLFLVSLSTYAADFSGTYQCKAYDSLDGKYNPIITLKLNDAYHSSNSAYATYDFSMSSKEYAYTWTGIAVANGSNLAVYFESTGAKKEPSDRGVGIATVVRNQDDTGKEVVSLHKFFYEQAYKGKSDYGFENCVLVK